MGKKRVTAFTLMELMITVMIIGLLLSVAVPSFQRVRLEAQESAAMAQLEQIRDAQVRVVQDTGRFAIVGDLYRATPLHAGYIATADGRFGPYSAYPPGTWKGPYLKGPPPVQAGNIWYTRTPLPNVIIVSDGWVTSAESGAYLWAQTPPFTASDGTAYRSW